MKEEFEKAGVGSKFRILGAGGCALCKECAYVKGEPCRRPDDALVSLEAFGMDVIRLWPTHSDHAKYNSLESI